MFQVIFCIVFLRKGATTEVILICDLNAREFLHGDAKILQGLMGMPNSLGNFAWGMSIGNFAWGCQIPCLEGDIKNTEGIPKSLRDLIRGCRIPYDICPLYRGCPLFGGSVITGFTVSLASLQPG